jgi:hypothetical protein
VACNRDLNHPERHAFERILRKVLGSRSQPAVILFEAFAWRHSKGKFAGDTKFPYHLGQEKHSLIAEYYGMVQMLSVRAALFQLMNSSMDPERLIYTPGGDKNTPSDMLHVSPVGHRFYADIIIHFFRDVATSLLSQMTVLEAFSFASQSLGTSDSSNAGPSIVPSSIPGTCHLKGHNDALSISCSRHQPELPEPFFPGNEVQSLGVCAISQGLFDLVPSPHDHWEWVDEGHGNSSHKWGFVSHEVRCLPLKAQLAHEFNIRSNFFFQGWGRAMHHAANGQAGAGTGTSCVE